MCHENAANRTAATRERLTAGFYVTGQMKEGTHIQGLTRQQLHSNGVNVRGYIRTSFCLVMVTCIND